MKTIKLETGIKVLQYQGLENQRMIVESKHLKKYARCNTKLKN